MGLVVTAYLRGDASLKLREGSTEILFRHTGECLAHKERAHRIDVAPDRLGSEFERLAKCRSASHERIEHDFTRQMMAFVEYLPNRRPLATERRERDRAKYRSQPRRPPFVNVVERSVYLLAPAFMFGDLAHLDDGEAMLQRRRLAFRCREFDWAAHSSPISSTTSLMADAESMVTGLSVWDFRR